MWKIRLYHILLFCERQGHIFILFKSNSSSQLYVMHLTIPTYMPLLFKCIAFSRNWIHFYFDDIIAIESPVLLFFLPIGVSLLFPPGARGAHLPLSLHLFWVRAMGRCHMLHALSTFVDLGIAAVFAPVNLICMTPSHCLHAVGGRRAFFVLGVPL